jgi:hypothetical protein
MLKRVEDRDTVATSFLASTAGQGMLTLTSAPALADRKVTGTATQIHPCSPHLLLATMASQERGSKAFGPNNIDAMILGSLN